MFIYCIVFRKRGVCVKITKDHYCIYKDNISGPSKSFLSLSDLHYGCLQQLFYQKMMKHYFRQIIQNHSSIDGILIPGDLLFYLTKYPDMKYIEALKSDFEMLSYEMEAPLFFSYGNHDVPLSKQDLEEQKWNLKYLLENRSNGIYVLDNEQVSMGDMVITGFSPNRNAYSTVKMPDPALKMALQEFQDCNFQFAPNLLHILMSHENKFFTYHENASQLGDLYPNLTFIIGGHLHDGYVPMALQKCFGSQLKDNGVWEIFPPQIDMCRGLFKVSSASTSDVILPQEQAVNVYLDENEAASIVNRGVAKYSWFCYGRPSYTIIDVMGSEDRSRVKIK